MRQSSRTRRLTVGFCALALVLTMVAPVGAADPPDGATLVARLTASSDPDTAFAKLSGADRQAVMTYLRVVTFDSTETLTRVDPAAAIAPN